MVMVQHLEVMLEKFKVYSIFT